eukprot:SAG31_NODE_8514_length_1438_cov_1.017177_2_plen_104_part_00
MRFILVTGPPRFLPPQSRCYCRQTSCPTDFDDVMSFGVQLYVHDTAVYTLTGTGTHSYYQVNLVRTACTHLYMYTAALHLPVVTNRRAVDPKPGVYFKIKVKR